MWESLLFWNYLLLTKYSFLLHHFHQGMKEDDICELLKFERKMLRGRISTLRGDKFLQTRLRMETVDSKSQKVNYYYINYKVYTYWSRLWWNCCLRKLLFLADICEYCQVQTGSDEKEDGDFREGCHKPSKLPLPKLQKEIHRLWCSPAGWPQRSIWRLSLLTLPFYCRGRPVLSAENRLSAADGQIQRANGATLQVTQRSWRRQVGAQPAGTRTHWHFSPATVLCINAIQNKSTT